MGTKYSDFIEDVISDLGRDTTKIRGRMDRWVNDAIRDCYRNMNLWLAQKTVTNNIVQGKRSYPMPELIDDAVLFYYLASDGNSWKEIDVKGDRAGVLSYGPNDTGTPKIITVGRASYNVFPLPDQTYTVTLKGRFYETPLTTTGADDEESDLINEFPEFVHDTVLQRGFKHLEEFDKAKEYMNYVQEHRREMRIKNNRVVLSGNFTIWPSSGAKGQAGNN